MNAGIEPISNRPAAELYDQDDSTNVCFLCEAPKYEPLYSSDHFGFPLEFQRCQCGLIKHTPMPNEAFFSWFFNSDLFLSAKRSEVDTIWGYHDFLRDEPSRLKTSRRRWRRLARHFAGSRPLEIMKIGPATGTFLYVANQHGHHAIGCDVSREFVEHARTHYDVQIDNGRFEHQPYQDEQFDVILMFNVIENIPNLPEVLQAIHRTLKPGGRFIFNYVNMKRNVVAWLKREQYFMFRPPITYMLDSDTVPAICKKYGFRQERTYADIRYMTLEKISTLMKWRFVHRLARGLRLDRVPFPIVAYPSQIVVVGKDR